MDINLATLKKAMIGQNEKNNIIANNLANLNTIGFKRDLLFAQTLEENKTDSSEIMQETDFTQGTLTATNNDLDLALTAPGFFTLETEDGLAFTRDGHFKMDSEGTLRSSTGYPVLGLNGWISLMKDGMPASSVEIAENGEIFIDDEPYDQLLIQNTDSVKNLQKAGDNIFRAGEDVQMYDVVDARVAQGFLEESNVNPAQEMIDLIDVQRQFESVQRMVRTLDDTFRIAASQVGQFR